MVRPGEVARRQLAITLAILAVTAVTAVAASGGSFAGTADQEIKVSFLASDTWVKRPKTSLAVNCVTAYPSYKGAIEIVAVSRQGSTGLRAASSRSS